MGLSDQDLRPTNYADPTGFRSVTLGEKRGKKSPFSLGHEHRSRFWENSELGYHDTIIDKNFRKKKQSLFWGSGSEANKLCRSDRIQICNTRGKKEGKITIFSRS